MSVFIGCDQLERPPHFGRAFTSILGASDLFNAADPLRGGTVSFLLCLHRRQRKRTYFSRIAIRLMSFERRGAGVAGKQWLTNQWPESESEIDLARIGSDAAAAANDASHALTTQPHQLAPLNRCLCLPRM